MRGSEQQSCEVETNKTNAKTKLLLVGAGPGDPELLTIKALNALRKAELILYDNLVNKAIFDLFPNEDKEFIYVGKQCFKPGNSQEDINDLILKNLQANKTVLRLKGGDPFIFARGVEEVCVAQENGFDVEIIPGLSSGISIPTLNGIPLTLRKKSDAVVLATGHSVSEDKVRIWADVLDTGATLIVYMGLHTVSQIQKYLLDMHMIHDLPVIAIQDGSLESQVILHSNLSNIVNDLTINPMRSPTILVFGKHIDC